LIPPKKRLAPHPKAWIALLMAWSAGYVDVVGWLVLYHVYSSHMTGNTASFARELASRNLAEAWRNGWPILPFTGGLLYSAAMTKWARRRGFHSSFSIALATEIFLLITFLILGTLYPGNGELNIPPRGLSYLLLSLPAAAMGMQTVTVTNIKGLRVYTTYLTGSLAKFSEAVVDFVFWLCDRMRHHYPRRLQRVLRASRRQKTFQHAALTAGLWISFFAGGICGAVIEARFALFSLVAPIATLSMTVVVDLIWPVAAADEPAPQQSAH
jgi:uncharacterized membrane protein YoaK (UPF0700 family)